MICCVFVFVTSLCVAEFSGLLSVWFWSIRNVIIDFCCFGFFGKKLLPDKIIIREICWHYVSHDIRVIQQYTNLLHNTHRQNIMTHIMTTKFRSKANITTSQILISSKPMVDYFCFVHQIYVNIVNRNLWSVLLFW